MSESTCISSGDIDEDIQLYTGRGLLRGVSLSVIESNSAMIHVYDGEDNTGNLLTCLRVSGGQVRTQSIMYTTPVRCYHGLFVEVTGDPSRAIVYFGG